MTKKTQRGEISRFVLMMQDHARRFDGEGVDDKHRRMYAAHLALDPETSTIADVMAAHGSTEDSWTPTCHLCGDRGDVVEMDDEDDDTEYGSRILSCCRACLSKALSLFDS